MGLWKDIAVWRGPTVNQGPEMNQQRGLVVHIASGFYEGTISWQKNPDANVSSHFVTGRDGEPLAQMVDTNMAAWTQRDGNGEWLSIECEGFATGDPQHDDYPGWERLTDHQMDQIAQVFLRGHREYGYPLQLCASPSGKGLGYHSMGAESGHDWGHSSCPGEPIKDQLPEILERALAMDGQGTAIPVEETMWQGIIVPGQFKHVICTPWDKSKISFGCDFGQARLRLAEHQVAGPGREAGWLIRPEFTISNGDEARYDFAEVEGVDRRSVMRVPIDDDDEMMTPVGYLVWLT